MKTARARLSDASRACLNVCWLVSAALATTADLDPLVVSQYAPSGEGTVEAIAVSGHYACLVRGSGLQTIDVSNAANPCYAGECGMDGYITRVRATENLAHLLVQYRNETNQQEGSRYEIVEVSDPVHPQKRGAYDLGVAEWGSGDLAIAGDHAYVTTSWMEGTNRAGRLRMIDISAPASPQLIGELSAHAVWSIAVSGGYACVVAEMHDSATWVEGLHVIDVSNPAHPHRVGGYAPTRRLGALTMSGRYAYVGADSGMPGSSLVVVDVSNPATPREVGSCRLGCWATCWEVAVLGRYACVAAEYGGVLVMDVSDPTHPRRVGRWATRAQTLSLTVAGRYVYAADGAWETCMCTRYPAGMVILDLESPACLQRLGSVDLPLSADEVRRSAVGVAVTGQHTYSTSTAEACDSDSCVPSTNRFHVIDTSDPTRPQRVGECDLEMGGWGDATVAVLGSTAYVDDEGLWLNAVDISDPVHPGKVRVIDLGGNGSGLAVSGGYVYAAGVSGDHGLFQVYDADSLQRVGLLQLPGRGSSVALTASYAYVAGENLEAIDISQPSNPQRVGGCPGLGGGWGGQIAVRGGLACVVGDGILRAFGVSEPTNPVMSGECTFPGLGPSASGTDIALEGDYAYVATAGAGVQVFAIGDPAHPRRVGGNSAFDAYALAIADGWLHVAAGEQGLVILNLYQPPRFESLSLDVEGFHLRLQGVTGQTMRLDRSRDLRTWEPWATVPIPASGQTLIDPGATAEPYLFYRAVSVP